MISASVFQRIRSHCSHQNKPAPSLRSTSNNCVSITGEFLKSEGSASITLSLPDSDFLYPNEFLVCSNLLHPLECVLGWDFLTFYSLQLSILGESYCLVGPHGCTPLKPLPFPANPQYQGYSASATQISREELPVFVQSHDYGPVFVTIENDISIPARAESVVLGRVPRSSNGHLGMVCATNEKSASSCYTAYSISQVSERSIPVRVLNISNSSVELHAGEKIARFWPVIESTSTTSPLPYICASVSSNCQINPDTLTELTAALSPNLNNSDRKKILDTLMSFPDVLNDGLGFTSVLSHQVRTGNSPPIKQYPRRLPYHYRGEIKQQVSDMLEKGVIQPSTSPWASPVVLVKKKDGSYRFCVDYRKLNLVTQQDAHPLPRVDDLLDSLNGNQIFSTLDLRSGYWQVSMFPEDREKTAFITPDGLFEFLRMPYGLSTAPATFARAIGIILSGLTYDTCLCYFDDVIIFSKTIEQHCQRLQSVLQRFRENGLRVKASKCSFGANKVIYLGHSVSRDGVHTDPSKIKAVEDLAAPTTIEMLRSFLGLAGYYRRFIPQFATLAAPLTDLTKKGTPFIWTDKCQAAFLALKTSLCSAPVLAYPKFNEPFLLQTDASNVGLGAVLAQLDDNGNERVVSYASRTLTPREQNYSAMEKEALAIVFATEHFRFYLLGHPFRIVTDNSALTWLHSVEPKGRIARWVMKLQEFDFTVTHRPGSLNQNADALSRLNHKTPPLQTVPSTPDVSCLVGLLPDTNLCQAQRTDPNILKVIELKEQGFPKPPLFAWKKNPNLCSYWNCWDQLHVHNGLLIRTLVSKHGFSREMVVIPDSLVPIILRSLHSGPSGGHMGIRRTILRCKERFFWPKLNDSVIQFIENCRQCSQGKYGTKQTRAPLQTIDVSEPFVFWAMDYMGPLPETACGNRHILVMMDHFTKWCEAFPTKDQKASTVAHILVSRVFSRFGPPSIIHSDQGKNFDSTLMHEIYNIMGVKKSRTTAYHPQGDGLVERQNRTLQEIISNFVSKQGNDWDQWLDQAVFSYNTSVHESTGISPYELVFGRPARMPIEVELSVPLRSPSSQSDYSHSLRKAIRHANQVAQGKLELARAQQSKTYNSKSHKNWKPFEPGQFVWLWRPKKFKFGRKWIGPYEVCSRRGVNYYLKSENGKFLTAHHNQLKTCPVPIKPGLPYCPSPETPGIVYGDFLQVGEQGRQGGRQEQPLRARPPHLRQVINPPDRFGEIVAH